jgi:hypothetical protein
MERQGVEWEEKVGDVQSAMKQQRVEWEVRESKLVAAFRDVQAAKEQQRMELEKRIVDVQTLKKQRVEWETRQFELEAQVRGVEQATLESCKEVVLKSHQTQLADLVNGLSEIVVEKPVMHCNDSGNTQASEASPLDILVGVAVGETSQNGGIAAGFPEGSEDQQIFEVEVEDGKGKAFLHLADRNTAYILCHCRMCTRRATNQEDNPLKCACKECDSQCTTPTTTLCHTPASFQQHSGVFWTRSWKRISVKVGGGHFMTIKDWERETNRTMQQPKSR